MQYSTVQCNTVQYNTAQYSTIQCCTIQYSAVQCSTVQCSAVQCSTVQYSTVQYSTVQYSTVQYSTVQYSTVQYSTVQYSTVYLVFYYGCIFLSDFILPKSVQNRHHFLTNLVKEDLLMVVKLSLDWLRLNPEVCECEDSAAMFAQLVQLLNILPKQEELWRIG